MIRMVRVAVLYTAVMAVLLGVLYPLAMTALAQLIFPGKANGQMLTRGGQVVGSAIVGQPFSGANYFHSRPSAAGAGYDAANSSGSNLASSSKTLMDSIAQRAAAEAGGSAPVPIDLVTASGSGLDPDVTPAAALYQVNRIAQARSVSPQTLRQLVESHIQQRQLGLLGEPRVNVLSLNLALDSMSSGPAR